MWKYLATFRPINIFFVAIAQILSAHFLNFSNSNSSFFISGIHWLVIGTASCTAFGYWLNDSLDISRDRINGVSRFVAITSPWVIYIHLLVFITISLLCGRMLGFWFLNLFISAILLLFFYNKWLKDFILIGNVVVSSLCFFSLYAVYHLIPDIDLKLILYFSFLAALVTLAREMVKDIEDKDGDSAVGSKTMPIKFSQSRANISIYIVLFITLCFILVSVFMQRSYLIPSLHILYCMYVGVFIILPLYWAAVSVRFAQEKVTFTELSRLLKYVIFVGILSILFF